MKTRSNISRREFLWQSGGGLGGIALASMLKSQGLLGASSLNPGPDTYMRYRPKAKRVIQLFMGGAASHVDTFDYKPMLIKKNGQTWDPGESVELFQSQPGNTFASPWGWNAFGKTGKRLSDTVAPLGTCVDDMAFVHNLVGKTGVHSQATYLQATGFQTPGFPGMGAWISYGLGSLNENLPTFVVLPDHRGYASNGHKNWDSAFLPTHHQGTEIFPNRENPINDLFATDNRYITDASEKEGLALLRAANRKHQIGREGDERLEARIRSYELAARMQLSAPEAMDIAKEPT